MSEWRGLCYWVCFIYGGEKYADEIWGYSKKKKKGVCD